MPDRLGPFPESGAFEAAMDKYSDSSSSIGRTLEERRRKHEREMSTALKEETKTADAARRASESASNAAEKFSRQKAGTDDYSYWEQERDDRYDKAKEKQGQYQTAVSNRVSGAEAAYVSGIDVATGERSIASAISQTQEQSGVRASAIEASQISSPELLQKRESADLSIEKISESLRTKVRELGKADTVEDKERIMKEMDVQGTALDKNIRVSAVSREALKERKASGQDEYDKRRRAETYMGRELKADELESARAMGKSGQAGTVESISKKLEESMGRLKKASDDLTKAHSGSAKDIAKAQKNFDKVQGEREVLKQQRMGSKEGGYHGASNMEGWQGLMNTGRAAVDIGRHAGITTPLQRMSMETGFAEMENARYGDFISGAGGDMAALRRMGLSRSATGKKVDQYAGMGKFGRKIGEREDTAELAELGLDIGSAGGAIYDVYQKASLKDQERFKEGASRFKEGWDDAGEGTGWKQKLGSYVAGGTQMASGAWDMASAINVPDALKAMGQISGIGAPVAKKAITNVNQISAGNRQLQASQTYMARMNAENKNWDRMAQTSFNRMMGVTESSRGMGAGVRRDLIDSMMDPKQATELATMYKDNELMQTIGTARDSFGADFTKENQGSLLKGAGRAANAGLVRNQSEYMQMAGQINQMGGDQNDLEAIMTRAVALGMDNSKNVKDMVKASMALSAGDKVTGLKTVEASARLVKGGIGAMMADGFTKSQASSEIGNQLSRLGSLGTETSRGPTIGGMRQFTSLFNQAPKGTHARNIDQIAKNVTMADVYTMRSMKDKKGKDGKIITAEQQIEDFAFSEGMPWIKNKDDVETLFRTKRDFTMDDRFAGTADFKIREAYKEHFNSNESAAEWRQRDESKSSLFSSQMKAMGVSYELGSQYFQGTLDTSNLTEKQKKEYEILQNGLPEDNTRTGSAQAAAKELSAAADVLSTAGSNFSEFNAAVGDLITNFKPADLATSAKEAAETLGSAERGLGSNLATLNTTINTLAGAIQTWFDGSGTSGSSSDNMSHAIQVERPGSWMDSVPSDDLYPNSTPGGENQSGASSENANGATGSWAGGKNR